MPLNPWYRSKTGNCNWCLTIIYAGSEKQRAASRLVAVTQLINQAVGDALSGMFLVEAILHNKGWSFQKWCDLYQDLPSSQLKVHFSISLIKVLSYCVRQGFSSIYILLESFFVWTVAQVKVADRTAIETVDAETRVVKPSALQELIDTETGGLSFLNPKNKL